MSVAVTRSVSVQASAADAFDAFTRVSDLLSWLCEGALVGLRPGGNWAVGFTDRRGMTEATVLGKIEEFERGRRLVVGDISYEPREGEALSGIRLELRIAESEGGCVVTDWPAATVSEVESLLSSAIGASTVCVTVPLAARLVASPL